MPETTETKKQAGPAAEPAEAGTAAPRSQEDIQRQYDLLDEAVRCDELTVRDDQYAFSLLLDAARRSAQKGGRFRLIDSGALEQPQLEWLLDAGADFYTSDDIQRDVRELELLSSICRRSRARLACFIHRLEPENPPECSEKEEGEEETPVETPDYHGLALTGAYLYFSNRNREWDFTELVRLAESCRRGGARLVYYHRGEFPPEGSAGLAEAGAWIHINQAALNEESRIILADGAAAAHKNGGGLIIHLQNKPDVLVLEDVFRAGAYVRFEYKHIDFRSPLKPFERAAEKQRFSPYAYYLHPDFLY